VSNEDLADLLLLWQERFQRGQDVPAEQLAAGSPDLIEELARQIEVQKWGLRLLRDADQTTDDSRRPSTTEQPTPSIPGYKILQKLDEGGMGVVYRATDHALGREVAVKALREGSAPDSAAARRFLEEARITAQLQHPAIPPVHQVGALSDGRPFLAMKLIQGRTLHELLQEQGPGAARWLGVFEAVCQAVAYAHSRGVIHRDLKPSNVMVGAFGEVQVMDWGLAKDLASPGREAGGSSASEDAAHTRAGAVMGTPAYMAPEQARGEPADARADVFALGSMLAAVLTGKPAFVGTTARETIARTAAGDLADVLARMDGCGADAELVALARRCLAVEPGARYADAREVAVAVAEYREAAEARAQQADEERVRAEERFEQQALMRELAEQSAKALRVNLTRQMADRIQADLERLARLGEALAATVEQGDGWDEKRFVRWMTRALELETEILGLCIAFEPDTFAPALDPVTRREAPLPSPRPDAADPSRDGYSLYVRHLPGEAPGKPVAEALLPSYRYRAQGWYANTLRGVERGWEEPCYDAYGGDTQLVTYTAPLYRPGGAPIGALCIDVSLAYFRRLDAWLRCPTFGDGSYAFVLSPKGKPISHPHLPKADEPFPDVRQVWRDPAFADDVGVMLARAGDEVGRISALDPATGRRSLFLYARVRPANWVFVAVIPDD
jgi:serine/threonine protein kinase